MEMILDCVEFVSEKLENAFSNRLKDLGKLYAFVYSIFLFTNPALVKYAKETNTFNVMFIRGLVIVFFSYYALKIRSKPITSIGKVVIYKLLLRGLVGSFSFFLFFWALNIVSMQVSLALYQTNPVFTYLLAVVFLGEKLTLKKSLCIFGMVFAFMLIVNPNLLFLNFKTDPNTENPLYLTAIAALIFVAFLAAVVNILLKSMKENDPSINNLFATSTSLFMSGIFYIASGTEYVWDFRKFIIFFLSGIQTIFLFSSFIMALKYEDVSVVSLLSSLTILYSFLADVFFFKLHPEPGSVVGCIAVGIFMTILILDKK
jgi:transporter family protein